MKLVKNTIYISLAAQFIAFIYGTYALIKYNSEDILSEIVILENIVQFIEFTFYFIFGFLIFNIKHMDIAKYRYYDWMITTPTMILSTMLYFEFTSYYEKQREGYNNQQHKAYNNNGYIKEEIKYENSNDNNTDDKLSILSFLQTNKENVSKAFLSNWGMLLFGYLQEIGYVSIYTSTLVGFGLLFYTFYILYQYVNTSVSYYVFLFMFLVWSLYGVAALFQNKTKNTLYNILDIFSKNVFGVFVSYIMIQMVRKE